MLFIFLCISCLCVLCLCAIFVLYILCNICYVILDICYFYSCVFQGFGTSRQAEEPCTFPGHKAYWSYSPLC